MGPNKGLTLRSPAGSANSFMCPLWLAVARALWSIWLKCCLREKRTLFLPRASFISENLPLGRSNNTLPRAQYLFVYDIHGKSLASHSVTLFFKRFHDLRMVRAFEIQKCPSPK